MELARSHGVSRTSRAFPDRKNAFFYKTDRNAEVGDIHMSLIHSCELCHATPSDYLTELQRHTQGAPAAPAELLPWNYQDAKALSPQVPDFASEPGEVIDMSPRHAAQS